MAKTKPKEEATIEPVDLDPKKVAHQAGLNMSRTTNPEFAGNGKETNSSTTIPTAG